jgi:hypothetical protein
MSSTEAVIQCNGCLVLSKPQKAVSEAFSLLRARFTRNYGLPILDWALGAHGTNAKLHMALQQRGPTCGKKGVEIW